MGDPKILAALEKPCPEYVRATWIPQRRAELPPTAQVKIGAVRIYVLHMLKNCS
jgi:hypothetical protein